MHPTWVPVDSLSAGTGIGKCRHLNGLLVVPRTQVVGATAPNWGDRQMAELGFAF